MYSTQSFDTDNFDVTYPCSMPLKDLCKWPNYPQSSMWSLITSAVLWKPLGLGRIKNISFEAQCDEKSHVIL